MHICPDQNVLMLTFHLNQPHIRKNIQASHQLFKAEGFLRPTDDLSAKAHRRFTHRCSLPHKVAPNGTLGFPIRQNGRSDRKSQVAIAKSPVISRCDIPSADIVRIPGSRPCVCVCCFFNRKISPDVVLSFSYIRGFVITRFAGFVEILSQVFQLLLRFLFPHRAADASRP